MQVSCDRETVFREFKPLSQLGMFLEKHDLSYTRVATAAIVLRIPVSNDTRNQLIEQIRSPVQPKHLSVYQIADWSSGRLPLAHNYAPGRAAIYKMLAEAFELLQISCIDVKEKRVTFARLSFASWILSVSSDPLILKEVSAGLHQRFPVPVSALRLSKWINGHEYPWKPFRSLLKETIECLVPGCGDELEKLLP